MLELQGRQRRYDDIRSLGAEVYFIGPELDEQAVQYMDKASSTIPVLLDVDGAVMTSYRVAYTMPESLRPDYEAIGLPALNLRTGWCLPLPATFVLDSAGIVRARHVNGDYRYRMDPDDVVGELMRIV